MPIERARSSTGSAACAAGCGAASWPSRVAWRSAHGGPRSGRVPVRARKTSSRSGVCTVRPSTSTARRRAGRAASRSDRDAAVAGHPQRQRVVVARGRAERARRAASSSRGVGEPQPDVAAGDEPLELVRRALGDEPAVVEHGDPVGELVGLLQVLGGEEDRDAAGDELADDLPHACGGCAGRGRWSARRGRSAAGRRPASSPGRAGAACRRSRSRPACRAASARSKRSSSSAARRRPSARPRWCRSAISSRFSAPVSRLSTAENWPVTPIAARTASGSRARSWPATRSAPAVGARSAWTGSAPSWSCRRRWGRAARRSCPRRRRGRCRRARPCRRTTCAGRCCDRVDGMSSRSVRTDDVRRARCGRGPRRSRRPSPGPSDGVERVAHAAGGRR